MSAGLSAVSNEHLKILSYCYTIKESNEMKTKKSERTVAFSAVIIFISLLFASCQTELIPEPEMEKIQSSTGGKNVQIEAPLTVKASHGRTKTVTVSWSTSNGATQYLIYSAESPHSEFVQIAETKGEASSIDIQEPAGTSAYYTVRAKNYEGTISSFSNVVFGSTMATPIISNITSNADGSASTVTWWMENCSASTYRDSVKYIVYCYDESGKEVTHAEASGAKTSAVLSGLTAKTRYIYQVEAYVESDQSNPELSDKVDEETARRLIPDAPEKLSAEKGTDKDAVSIRWTLPQFCDVAVSGGVYERHPLYFTIERKLKNEDDSTYEKIVSYLGTEKKTSGISVLQFSCSEEDMADINADGVSVQLPPQSDADAERSSNYPRYVSHSVITYCDSTAERGKQYIYRVQSYVDDVKRTVSAETAAATAEGFLLSKPTFSASAVYNYQKDQDGKNTNTISSIKVSFKTTFEPFGQDYSYLVYRRFTPMKQDNGSTTGDAEDRLLVSASSSSTLNTETDVFDFNNKNFNIGYYQYTLYICAPGESEVTNAYDSITTGGKITVIDDASKLPSITMFQIKDGYADHFNIKWNYDENCQYKLEWKSSDDNFEEQHSYELADGEYSVNGGTAEYNHTAQSGEGRIYTITAYMGIEVSRTYPLSENDETQEPEKLYTLGTARPKTTDIGYRAISVSWEPVVKADGTYTVHAYYEDDASRANELAAGKYTVTEQNGTYSCTITEPAGFDNPARSGLPIIMEITAKNADTGETTVARHTVRTLGPAAVNACANEEPESDVISVTWNKAEGAVGYLIRRLSYADNSCKTVERAVTYYCTLEGGESVEVLGDYETDPNAGNCTRADIESIGETLMLKDCYSEPTTAEKSVYQESQSKLSWGRPYGYVVLPVKDGADFTFNEDSATLSAGSAVDYTADGKTLSETIGSTLGYGLNLVAAKAEKAREQGIKWVAPYKPLLPVIYRRAAGSGDAFVKFSDNREMQDKTDVTLQIRDSYYDAFEYIVKYYQSYDDVAMEIEVASSDKDEKTIMPPSLLAEISRHVQNYDTPQGTMMELDNKGYLLTVSGFNAQCHPKESYYEQLLWDDWNYGKRAVGPDKMVFLVQNNNIDAEYHELVTVSKAKAYSGIDVHGDDVVAEAEASNSIRVAPEGIVEGTSGTTNGMLKVLRDYKHTYTLKLKRGDITVVSYSEYEQDSEKTAWRELTAEELLIVSMDTIRSAFKKKWFTTGSAGGDLDSSSYDGNIDGKYYTGIDRNGFFGTNYRRYQRFENYTDSFVKVNGTMMKDNGSGTAAAGQYHGTWLHKGSSWPSDSNFNPRTDYLTVSLTYLKEEGHEGQIKLNSIKIDNDDANTPKWVSGTFEVTYNGKTETFDNTQVPFGFLMNDETFYNKVEEMCY